MSRWEIYDTRDGECAQMSVYGTEAAALKMVILYWRRDREGRRLNISAMLPYLSARRMIPERCTGIHRPPKEDK